MVYLNEIAPGFLELATLRRQMRDKTVARHGGGSLMPDHERDQALRNRAAVQLWLVLVGKIEFVAAVPVMNFWVNALDSTIDAVWAGGG